MGNTFAEHFLDVRASVKLFTYLLAKGVNSVLNHRVERRVEYRSP